MVREQPVSSAGNRPQTSKLIIGSTGVIFAIAAVVLALFMLGPSSGVAAALPTAVPKAHPALRDGALRRIAIAAAKRRHGLPPGVRVPGWALLPGRHPYFLPAPGVGPEEFSEAGAFAEAQENSGESVEPNVPEEGPEEPATEISDSNELGLRCGASYCAVPPLRYLGGLVQHQPNVHLIFWGSNWQSGSGNEARLQILSMFEGLSNSAYQGILTQYFDTTGRISSAINLSSTVDTRVTAPTAVTDSAIQGEVAWSVSPSWKREPNAQFMVLTAPGSTYGSGFGGFCAYHDIDSEGGIYSIIPWAGDPPFSTPANCASYYGKGDAADATSVMASHEYAESATDPRWDISPGWKSLDGKEVTDICATPGDQLPNGAIVQGQYDDHQSGCSLSDLEPPHVLALSDNPSNVTRHGGTIHATINPEGLPTTYRFEYGTSTAYGTYVPASGESSAGSGIGNVEVEAKLSGLTLGQTYHYRVSATNSSGTTYGEDRTFMPSNWLIRATPSEPVASSDWLNGVSCASEQFCMAVGHYFSSGNRALAYEKIGHIWSAGPPVPMPVGANAIELMGISCTSANACTAVGRVRKPAVSSEWLPVVMRWNGASWAEQSFTLPTGSTGSLSGVSCVSGAECLAVGRISDSGGERNFSAVWKNGNWTNLSTPTAAESTYAVLEDVSCGGPESCVAVGWYNPSAGAGKPTLIAWNGSTWSTMTAGDSSRGRYGVSCVTPTSCTTVGVENRIEVWNGTTWTKVSAPVLQDVNGAILLDVSCVSASNCTAVGGGDSKINGRNLTIAERWNGASWSVETTPRQSERARNEFVSVACLPLECTAVGFSLASGETRSLIEARRMPDLTATFVSNLGSTGTGSGQLERPWGLDVDGAGNIWVADKVNNRVQEFNAKGEFVLMFGKEVDKTTKGNICAASSGHTCGIGLAGTGDGQFNEPQDVAVTSGGDLWVSDGANGRVQKFNAQGAYLAQFGSSGTGNGQFTEPWGIDTAPDGSIWVADARYYRVQQFSSAGTWIRTVHGAGNGGSGPAEFAGPRGLAVDPEGHVWVTDRGNNRVTELSPTGGFLSQFGSEGTGEGQFDEPQAIAVTPSGDLLVADRFNGRVEEFSPDGDFEAQIGTKGTGSGQFSEPRGVAVGASGLLYISDTHNNRIQKWQQASKPEVATLSPTAIGEAGATLVSSVNPGGLATNYYFEYGTTTDYGAKVPSSPGSAGSSHETGQPTATVSGLKPNTSYHYRVVAGNADGVSFGSDQSFTTEGWAGPRLNGMAVTEPFDASSTSLAEFSSSWAALGWAGGTTPKGEDTTTGWRSPASYPTANGAYYIPNVADVGSGVGVAATMAVNPGNVGHYFSLWLDATSGAARSGYELRFTYTASNTYSVNLAKWQGGTQSLLATRSGYTFINGNSFAVADEGGTISAWTNTGSGYKQILTAADTTYSGGKVGVEGAGSLTRLNKLKAGSLLAPVATMNAALSALPVRDAFATTETPLSGGGAWGALAWDNSTTGHNTGRVSGGWGPYNTFPTVNGAYWTSASFPDTGSGIGVDATLVTNPASSAGRYFSLHLDMPSPATAHTGYELRFTETSSNVYEVALLKWQAGSKTGLASKTGYSFPVGNHFALVDKGGTVSAWAKTGSEYVQLISASDSSFGNGYAGIEGSGSSTRISNFRAGPLSPF